MWTPICCWTCCHWQRTISGSTGRSRKWKSKNLVFIKCIKSVHFAVSFDCIVLEHKIISVHQWLRERSSYISAHIIPSYFIPSEPKAPWSDAVCRGCDEPDEPARLSGRGHTNWVASQRTRSRWNKVRWDKMTGKWTLPSKRLPRLRDRSSR